MNDQDTTTGRPGNGDLPDDDLTPRCLAEAPGRANTLCNAAAGHAGPHMAYGTTFGVAACTWDTDPAETLDDAGLNALEPTLGPVIETAPAGARQAGPPPLSPYDGSVTGEAGPVAAPADPERAASVALLRSIAAGYAQFADLLESRPAIPVPSDSMTGRHHIDISAQDAGAMAAAARALPCDLAKSASPDGKWLNLTGQLGPVTVEIYAARKEVCTIVGYEDREVEETVTPAVKRTVTKPVPVWECAPILAARRTASMA